MGVLAVNKRANYDYEILDRFEAGVKLLGHEVKAAKDSQINLKGSYISADKGELFLVNCNISKYKKAGKLEGYDPQRRRKLLMNKKEIKHIIGKLQEKGLTIVPIKVYTSNNKIKLEIGIGKGKKKYDKRQDIKKRDVKRDLQQKLKQY